MIPEPARRSLWQRLTQIAQWPTSLVLALTIVDSALTVLNQTTFGLPTATKTTVTLLLGGFAYLGIGPVLGPKFKALVHLPPRLAGAIGLGLLVVSVAIQQNTSVELSAVLLGVLQFAGGLGFAPSTVPTV